MPLDQEALGSLESREGLLYICMVTIVGRGSGRKYSSGEIGFFVGVVVGGGMAFGLLAA